MRWRVHRGMRYLRDVLARPDPCPVLVFGNQKSGTSAVAGMLARVTGATVTLELEREYEAPSYPRVVSGELSVDAFIRRNRFDFSKRIVKEPNLLVLWRPLLAEYPDSPRILVVRDPRNNIRSVLDRLRLPGDREEVTDEERRGNGPGCDLYLDGRWLGIPATHYIEVMAHRWNMGYEFWKANRDDAVLIRYEDFVRDKEETVTGLARRVGLPIRQGLGDASDYRYQPRGTARADWNAVFGRENRARIERICAEGMAELGYDIGA